ncbi:MAG: glycosyltransferase family 4 protein [Candidatus Didemnitutus sp.]|nr:glycosyltransferase family 4 protein [Candidatus Didemnitutus sp.]
MKILVYSNCPLDPALGSGKTRVRFSEGLRTRGHSVRVIEPATVRLWPQLRAGHRFRLALGALRHAQRTLAQQPWDMVVIQGGEFGWLARWLARRSPRPRLVHYTDGCELLAGESTSPRPFLFRLHRALDRAAFRWVDGCISVSGQDCRYLVETRCLPAVRVRCVPPGLDEEFLVHPAPGPRAPRLVFLGSWIDRKGIAELVPSATALLTQYPQLELDLLGTARSEAELRECFPALVRPRVHGAGLLSTAELARRLTRASIFVLPARYEGFGMATAEAMACGCAVVTTPTGFGADLQDGVNALRVPFQSPDALTRALARLTTDDGLRHRLAIAGWQTVQTFAWSQRIDQLETIYREWHQFPP